ncbi:hypothetical protein AWH56_018335 [Anaerobacillus isosaccharinicus]|uniref:Uncharacterized protein n=1 Tax=Anaerobacillus isosaccharinicus TaxID=1532552 RepID=A0A1S2LEP2_9BACI|nr:hypothetical protein [Anaerobacillus isosaccharinicus]MBA5587136.1 hypothetical protein [Anaerobacillus isosaccharinicus]QOY34667.1 hypothetical protein AWH56_018335 [Anaerobacillus isosaccharinicus]
MKKLNILAYIVLILVSTILINQLISANKTIELYKQKEVGLFSRAIWDYTGDLSLVAETLLDYSEGYTDEEKDLYDKLLSSHGLRLNRHMNNLDSLRHLSPTYGSVYEMYFYYIDYLLLKDIKNLSEREVHIIGNIINTYGSELYAEIREVDYSMLTSDETEMRRILDIVSKMNNDILKVVNGE